MSVNFNRVFFFHVQYIPAVSFVGDIIYPMSSPAIEHQVSTRDDRYGATLRTLLPLIQATQLSYYDTKVFHCIVGEHSPITGLHIVLPRGFKLSVQTDYHCCMDAMCEVYLIPPRNDEAVREPRRCWSLAEFEEELKLVLAFVESR